MIARVLGIDPGLDRTGWAVLETKNGHSPFLISAGLLHTPAKTAFGARLEHIFDALQKIMADTAPDYIAMEEMFFLKRAKTVLDTVQARGVITLAAHLHGAGVSSYSPKQVKTTITGNGNADKRQMQAMVKTLLGLKETPRPDDVADAMAIALCHIKLFPLKSIMAQARNKINARIH